MTKGFTLAEVLITLGIIGVVATLTMPALISNYQSKVWSTGKTVFESRLEQVLQQMNVAGDLVGLADTGAFVDNLQKYIKIINVCKNDFIPCFAYPDATFAGEEKTDIVAVVIQNGTTALIQYTPDKQGCKNSGIATRGADLRPCIKIAYDTNGLKKPNETGKDMQGDGLILEPGDDVEFVQMNGFIMTKAEFTPEALDTCAENPENIHCATDRWAGAKKVCEDLGPDWKLPSGYSGSYSADSGYCNGTVVQGAAPDPNSQACQISNWCKTNACSGSYWLADYASATHWAYHLMTFYDYVVSAQKNSKNSRVRCVK